MAARIFSLVQRILPKHLLTSLVYRISRVRLGFFKDFVIRQFIRIYDVDTEEVAGQIPDDFEHFNAFFVRELNEGSRAIDSAAEAVVSPVDGTVSSLGRIENDTLFQAKGLHYGLSELLAADIQDSATYLNGRYATIYLAPHNYHRVHAPIDSRLVLARYVPGDLYSVNAATVAHVDQLFARNERLVCHFQSRHGPYVLIFVGALNVGSITTPWTGEIRPRARGLIDDWRPAGTNIPGEVKKGDLLGWFNLGSTVILLFPDGKVHLENNLAADDEVRMGQRIGITVSDP